MEAKDVQKMLQDTIKGLATMEELRTAVSEKVAAEFASHEADSKKQIDGLTTQLTETANYAKSLEVQVKRLIATRFEDIKTPDGFYKGIFPSLKMAENFGLFVMAQIGGNKAAAQKLMDQGIELRKMVEDRIEVIKDVTGAQNITGGAVIPTYFMGMLPSLLGAFGVFRQDAQEWPMASESTYAAMQTSDVVVYSPGAGAEPTDSNPGFKNVGLTATKLMTLTAINTECTEDMAVAIGEIVMRSIARAFSRTEDKCGFIGDGSPTYFRFVGLFSALAALATDLTTVAGVRIQATAGTWAAIVIDDINALLGIVDDEADDGNGKFYCHRNFYHTVILNLALKMGGTTAKEALYTGFTREPQYQGRPVRFVRCMPRVKAAADHWPLGFGNLKMSSLLGQARAVTIDTSREAYFKTDQIGIRGTERVAINNSFNLGTLTTASDPAGGAFVGLRADIA